MQIHLRSLAGVLLLLDFTAPRAAQAACSTVAPVPQTFRGARGVIDRPFVVPGDFAGPDPGGGPDDWLWPGGRVTLTLDQCAPVAGAFDVSQHVVTVVFNPPAADPAAPRNALVLALPCTKALENACKQQLSEGGNARCVPTPFHLNGSGTTGTQFWFKFPNPPYADAPTAPLAGPAAIVVSEKNAPRCDIGGATPTCPSRDDPSAPLLCIDDLFDDQGCGPLNPHADFPNFTVLPGLNDFRQNCSDNQEPPPCATANKAPLRFAIDKRGNALIPVKWLGVLRGRGGGPPPNECRKGTDCDRRRLRGFTAVDPFPNDPNRNVVAPAPGTEVRAFNMRGAQFVNDLVITHSATPDGREFRLDSEAHKGKSVIRIPSCDDRTPCTPFSYFDFRDRMAGGVGPVSIPAEDGPGICEKPGKATPPNGTATPRPTCTSDAECTGGAVCSGYRAFALDQITVAGTPPSGQPPSPLPTGATPTVEGPSLSLLLALVALLGVVLVVAVLLVRQRSQRP